MPTAYLRPVVVASALVAVVAGLVLLVPAAAQDFGRMSVATLLVSAGCVVLVATRWEWDFTRLPVVWLVLFCFFHFGLVWTLGLLGPERVAEVSSTALYWVRTPFLRPAVTVAAVAASTYAAVAAWRSPREPARTVPGRRRVPRLDDDLARARLGVMGVAVQLLGVVVLGVTVVRNGGLALLGGGYLAFLEQAQDATTGYAIWAVGVGSCLSQLGERGVRRSGVLVFAVVAVVLFPLGLRGSVLFPACVLIATRGLVGLRTPRWLLAAAALVVLSGSAVVRRTRVGGSGAREGPLDGALSTVTELGFSLRPTTEVLRWAGAGEDPSWFVSFVAVPIRFVEGLTGWHGGPPVVDHRLFNVKVNDLVGPIGGSPVAEGYDAAGLAGVLLVMAGIAAVLAWVSAGPGGDWRRLALFPVVALPLTVAVRNSFAPVLPQVALGLVLVLVASGLPFGRRSDAPASMPAPALLQGAARGR